MATHQVGHTGGSGVHRQVGDVVVHGLCGYGRVRVRSATTRTARPSPVVARIELVLGMPLWHTWFDEGRQGKLDDVEALNLSETSQVESLSELLLELLSEQSRPALRSNLRILAIRKHECFSHWCLVARWTVTWRHSRTRFCKSWSDTNAQNSTVSICHALRYRV